MGKRKTVLTKKSELITGDGERSPRRWRRQRRVVPVRAFPALETKSSAVRRVIRGDKELHFINGDRL